jgi:hypothetical protein
MDAQRNFNNITIGQLRCNTVIIGDKKIHALQILNIRILFYSKVMFFQSALFANPLFSRISNG